MGKLKEDWTEETWDDGYIHKGRMYVKMKNHPQSIKGFVLRSQAVWWLQKGEDTKGFCLHHKNENMLNDGIENLEKMTNKEHTSLHNPKQFPFLICHECGKPYYRKRSHTEKYHGKFCSYTCKGKAKSKLMIRDNQGRFTGEFV